VSLAYFWLFCLSPLALITAKHFSIIWLSNILALSIPNEGYLGNVP
jgi:hypothetical protein